VIGCSLFGIGWGVANIFIIRNTNMEDYSKIVAGEDEEQNNTL